MHFLRFSHVDLRTAITRASEKDPAQSWSLICFGYQQGQCQSTIPYSLTQEVLFVFKDFRVLKKPLSKSDATSVTLKGVNRGLSGTYQCEVSEDAPLFHTEIRSAHMQVIELPKDNPVMQVDKKVIGINDHFKAVCTVGPSYPPANITWLINTRPIHRTPQQRITQDAFDGSNTYSSLEILPHSQVLQGFFETNYQHSVSLQCEVTILHMFHKIVEARIGLNRAPPTTISPNLLGLEGSKRYVNGDPDNSALTGASQRCCICCGALGAISLAIFTLALAQL
ncbi:hypothetical protein M5D96_002031 [Drosophila gunungcola]|uniref:CD80-like immunoglobulin C2-set domain-containing protein n=1 Tax=Drosophila gunungcola TaxID=103775 RepID=A0A9Q0BV45_9MUSC|nr:hypothetical protein M5D96_002031 [Drosophila gunungcola]